jgi:hypothetical protein
VLDDVNAAVDQEQNGTILVTYSDRHTGEFPPCGQIDTQFTTNGWVEAAYDNVLAKQVSGAWAVPSSP